MTFNYDKSRFYEGYEFMLGVCDGTKVEPGHYARIMYDRPNKWFHLDDEYPLGYDAGDVKYHRPDICYIGDLVNPADVAGIVNPPHTVKSKYTYKELIQLASQLPA